MKNQFVGLVASVAFVMVVSGSLFNGAYAEERPAYLLFERFAGGKLTEGLWDVKSKQVSGVDSWGQCSIADGGSIYSLKTFDRKPGRCLGIVRLGTVARGGGKDNPTLQFARAIRPENREQNGPGWYPGQFQGRFVNTAVPLVEKVGIRNYAERNDNIDTLHLTVLREQGAFYLLCGEPTSTPPKAKLCLVSHTGDGSPYHVAVHGGQAHNIVSAVMLADLDGPWAERYGIATLVDSFKRNELGKPDRGGSPWQAVGEWKIGAGKLTSAGAQAILLTDAGTADGQWDVVVTPGEKTAMVGLVFRAKDAQNFLKFQLTRSDTRLVKYVDGVETEIAPTTWREMKLAPGQQHRLSVRAEKGLINLYVDDIAAQYGLNTPAELFKEFIEGGTKVGVIATGEGAVFEEFSGWPCYVEIPKHMAEQIPPVFIHADGEIILQDDFAGETGASLEGRKPQIGQGAWKIGKGDWSIRDGAAMIKADSGFVRIDSGVQDYEIWATIELPKPELGPQKEGVYWNWFPAVCGRATGPTASSGWINARFLWQGLTAKQGSPEIEVWDRPEDTAENRAKWLPGDKKTTGDMTTILINATNISGMIAPGQAHVLRMIVHGNRVCYFCDDLLVGTAYTRVEKGAWVGLNMDAPGEPACRWLDFTVRAFKPQ